MPKNVICVFYSKIGSTKLLAKRILDVFRALFPKNITMDLMDLSENYDLDKIKDADGLVIGTPDYFGYPAGVVKTIFDELYETKVNMKGKPAFGFVSHGGGGKAAKPLSELMSSIKLKEVGQVISVKRDNINSKIQSQIQKNCQKLISEL